MKIREGLVSNSSSTSFCIYGTVLNDDTIEELKEKHSEHDSVYDLLDKVISDKKLDLSFHCPYEDQYYLGRSWSKVKDNQTGLEFKQDVKKQIVELLGKEVKIGTLEEAWRDG